MTNVIDQLVAWENEYKRLQTSEVIMIDLSGANTLGSNHKILLEYIVNMNLYCWKNEDYSCVAVPLADYPIVQKYAVSLGFS